MTKTYCPGYGSNDECRTCGEHLSHPHSPGCPAGAADQLREHARRNEARHGRIMRAGGYAQTVRDASRAAEGDGSRSVKISFLLLAVAQRMAAELVELDQAEQTNLDEWESAAEFVAYLTGEADPFETDYYQPRIPTGPRSSHS